MNEIAVLVDVRGPEVRIQELIATEYGPALNNRGVYTTLGTVHQIRVEGTRGGHATVWRWESEGYTGTEKTKTAAIAAMLADVDYTQVALNATIPDLLDGWDGAA